MNLQKDYFNNSLKNGDLVLVSTLSGLEFGIIIGKQIITNNMLFIDICRTKTKLKNAKTFINGYNGLTCVVIKRNKDCISADIFNSEDKYKIALFWKECLLLILKDTSPKLYSTLENSVTIKCYDKEQTMDRQKAIKFYQRAINSSEGAEQRRYLKIYDDLTLGKSYCSDEDEEEDI